MHVDVDRQIASGAHYRVVWNVDVELVGSGPIVDVRDVGKFVDIIDCTVVRHAVAVSCAAVDAHLQDDVECSWEDLPSLPQPASMPDIPADFRQRFRHSLSSSLLRLLRCLRFELLLAYIQRSFCKRKQCSGVSYFCCNLRGFAQFRCCSIDLFMSYFAIVCFLMPTTLSKMNSSP